jgi:prevent-host-death family protein
MKIASVAEIKSQLSAFLKASEAGPVIVTRNGKAVAAIVAIQDEEEVEGLLLAYSPRLRAIVEASRRQIREGDVLSHEAFWAEVEKSRASESHGRKRTLAEPVAAPDRGGRKRSPDSKSPGRRGR